MIGKYILWADDDLDDLLFMQKAMQQFDQQLPIIEVQNGLKVLEYLENLQDPSLYPHLIVLDMNMPVLNGRDTLMKLKLNEKFSSIPVIVFTTSNSLMDRMFCRRYEVEMFTKPHGFIEYMNTIHQLLNFSNLFKGQD